MEQYSEIEHIGILAKKINELRAENKIMAGNLKEILNLCICIGGPLNDNRLKYTPDQMVIFQKIVDLT